MLGYCPRISILTIITSTFVLVVRSCHKKILPKSISLCKTTTITAHVSLVFVLVFNTRQTLCSGFKIQTFKQRLEKNIKFRYVKIAPL